MMPSCLVVRRHRRSVGFTASWDGQRSAGAGSSAGPPAAPGIEKHAMRDLERHSYLSQRIRASSDVSGRGNVDGDPDQHSVRRLGRLFVTRGWQASPPRFAAAQRCYTPPMFGKVKRLRAGCKRLSSYDIGRSDYVEGEVESTAWLASSWPA